MCSAYCGTPTKRKVTVCIVDIAVYMKTVISFDNNGSCFFDERQIPFYLITILFVICQLTYLILSAIIIDINIAIHREDTKMDIRKITPLLIGFEEVLKCALYATE